MSNIKILDSFTANQIAAGEVVERPASVVKELCENSLDAGASVISISIQNGGIVSIAIVDNGIGMDREDAKIAFLRHATSKLNTIQDFDTIKTMGFRGEALASIAAVSKITLKTKQIGSQEGSIIRIDDGKIVEHGPAGCPEGTHILVEYLFYNTPARYKFLKKDATEGSYITDIVERFILARPDVSFRLNQNNQEILHSPGNNDLKSAIFSVYGKAITQSLIPVSFQTERIAINGFIGKPEIGRNTRQNQSVFVNSRYVKSKVITAAIEEGYKTLLMKGKFAFCVINIDLSPALVDVNVHPQKTEVKFWNDQELFLAVLHALKEALATGITIQEIAPADKKASASAEAYHYPVQQEITEPQTTFVLKDTAAFALKNTNEESVHAVKQTAASDSQDNHTAAYDNDIQKNISIQNNKDTQQTINNMENSGGLKNDVISNQQEPEYNRSKKQESEYRDPISLKVNELSKARYIGALFHTYLLLELDDNLILIDQHAAHERILFEKLVAKYKNNTPIAQPLLTPELIELAAHEILLVSEHLDFLSKIGFECEVFGTQTVMLRSVPLDIREIDIQDAFKSVLDTVKTTVQSDEDQISHAFYSIACKAAVKARDILDDLEIAHLLEELRQIPNPTHCPHGRPVVLKMSQYEIEKGFKRIVT